MALFTKAQVRTAVAQAIDDPSNQLWTSANLDILITLVLDTMWEAILDTWENLTSQTDALVPSSGIVALGGLTKRLYRIQKVTSGGSEYQAKLPNDSVPQNAYHLLGATLVTTPSVGSTSTSVQYAYIPPKFNDLATDNTLLSIEYPEGHEAAAIYLSAAWALAKGDEESIGQVALLADQALEAMLVHISRLYPIGANNRVAQVKATIMRNMLMQQQAAQ